MGVIGIGVAVWLLSPDRRPYANGPLTPRMLQSLIETLLYRGMDGGELRICSPHDVRELLFRKYVRAGGLAGVSIAIAGANASGDAVEVIRHELHGRGLRVDSSSRDGSLDALSIDFGLDISQAPFAATLLVRHLFGLTLGEHWVGYFNDRVLPTDKPGLTGVTRPRD